MWSSSCCNTASSSLMTKVPVSRYSRTVISAVAHSAAILSRATSILDSLPATSETYNLIRFDSICLVSWGATGTQQTKKSVDLQPAYHLQRQDTCSTCHFKARCKDLSCCHKSVGITKGCCLASGDKISARFSWYSMCINRRLMLKQVCEAAANSS